MVRLQTFTAGAVVAGLLLAGAAFAQGPRGGGPRGGRGPGGPGGPFGFMGAELALGMLDLSDAQRQQVRDVRERHRETIQEIAGRVRVAREAQQAAITALPVDEARIRAATQAVADVQADAAVQAALVRSEIWAILTPAQQEQVTKRRTAVEERMKARQSQRAERQGLRPNR